MRLAPLAIWLLLAGSATAGRAGGRVEGRRLLQARESPAVKPKQLSTLQEPAAAANATAAMQQAAADAANALTAVVGQTVVASAKSTAAVQQAVVAAANATAATAATAAAVALRAAAVPGTPLMERDMPLKAPEQGFEGEHVQHKDKETETDDWQKEYGHQEPVKLPVRSAGTRVAVGLSGILLCLASAL